MRQLWPIFSRPGKGISKMRPHHEITDIRELQLGQLLWGASRGATTFYGIQGGWSGIAELPTRINLVSLCVCLSVKVLKPRSRLSRSWNPNPVCRGLETQIPSVEVLKPRSRLSRFWNPDPVYRGPKTQISSIEVLKPRSRLSRSWNPDLVCRGPETQIPSVRLSRSWNPDPKL
jgi:hypothetical protein